MSNTADHLLSPHEHVFLGAGHEKNERKTWAVIVLCSAMMLVEIVGGTLYGSLALVADGLHMSTHAGAMLIAVLRFLPTIPIHFREEIPIAVVGLGVNIVSAWLLSGGEHHGHSHGHGHNH